MLHPQSSVKATPRAQQADLDHLAVREGVELLVPLRSEVCSGVTTLAQARDSSAIACGRD